MTYGLRNNIWAIGGGKGGVGKSFVSSSLAICLSKMGKSVTLIDLDLGSANLHTCLGLKIPPVSITDFISGRVPNIRQLVVETDIPYLSFISGFNDSLNIAEINASDRQRLMTAIHSLTSQYVILDLGAGTSENTMDFFNLADKKIVVATPEPTSIENVYRFLKTSFYKTLLSAESEVGLQALIDQAMDSRNEVGIRTPNDLLRHIMQVKPQAGARLANQINQYKIQLIINQTRTKSDGEIGYAIRSVCHKYFGIEANYIGHIDHDNAMWQALRKRKHLIIDTPYSSLVGQCLSITKNLMNSHPAQAVV